MRAWLDVTAGMAGDMLMGALVDAGADLGGVRAAIRAVVGEQVEVSRERVLRAGVPATKMHVDIQASGRTSYAWPELRDRVASASLAPHTRELALATMQTLADGYMRGHGLAPDQVALHGVAALDVLADVVGDCEGLRLLGVTGVSASPVALGSGRIRTSHGDLPVPVPAVAVLADGWPVCAPAAGDETVDAAAPHAFAGATRYVPVGGVSDDSGVITEGPAPVVDGAGELATPTGMALLRTLAMECLAEAPFEPRIEGVGAGGRDVPGRPNVVRVVLGAS